MSRIDDEWWDNRYQEMLADLEFTLASFIYTSRKVRKSDKQIYEAVSLCFAKARFDEQWDLEETQLKMVEAILNNSLLVKRLNNK